MQRPDRNVVDMPCHGVANVGDAGFHVMRVGPGDRNDRNLEPGDLGQDALVLGVFDDEPEDLVPADQRVPGPLEADRIEGRANVFDMELAPDAAERNFLAASHDVGALQLVEAERLVAIVRDRGDAVGFAGMTILLRFRPGHGWSGAERDPDIESFGGAGRGLWIADVDRGEPAGMVVARHLARSEFPTREDR